MNKLKLILFFCVTSVLFFEGILIFTNALQDSVIYSNILQIELAIVYLSSLIYTSKKYGYTSVFFLFLLCLGLFNFQSIFFSSLVDSNFRQVYSLIFIDLNEIVVQKTLFIYIVFTFFITFFYCYFDKSKLKSVNISLPYDNNLFKIGRIVMLSFLGFALYRNYLQLKFLGDNPYALLYAEGNAANISAFLRTATIFFQVGYMIILGSKPKEKQFIIYSFLFLVTFIPDMLIGIRGTMAATFLFTIWYYFTVYNIKVKIRKLLIPVIATILLLQIVSVKRSREDLKVDITQLIPMFLIQQSQSMYVLSLYIQYEKKIMPSNYPYILDPFISWMYPSGQTMEVLEKRSSLGHQLIYSLNPGYYLNGNSLGTNFIAELYEFGILGVILGAILFSWFIAIFNLNFYKNRNLFLLSMFIVQYFFFAPRSTFFPYIYFLGRYVIVYFFIIYIYIFLKDIFIKNSIPNLLETDHS